MQLWPLVSLVELLTVLGASVDFWARTSCPPGLHDPAGIHPKYAVQEGVEAALHFLLPPSPGRWGAQAYGFVLFLGWVHVLVRRIPSFAGLDWRRGTTKLAALLYAGVLGFCAMWGTSPASLKRGMLLSAVRRYEAEHPGVSGPGADPAARDALAEALDTLDRTLGTKCVPRLVQALLYPSMAALTLLAVALYFSWASTTESAARAAAAAAEASSGRAGGVSRATVAAAAAAAKAGKAA